jgi:hypothetical protein
MYRFFFGRLVAIPQAAAQAARPMLSHTPTLSLMRRMNGHQPVFAGDQMSLLQRDETAYRPAFACVGWLFMKDVWECN